MTILHLTLLGSVASAVFTTGTCGRSFSPFSGFGQCRGSCEPFPVDEYLDVYKAQELERGLKDQAERDQFLRFVDYARDEDFEDGVRQQQWQHPWHLGWRLMQGYNRAMYQGRYFQEYDCKSHAFLCTCIEAKRYFFMPNRLINQRWRSKIAQGVLQVVPLVAGVAGGAAGSAQPTGGIGSTVMPISAGNIFLTSDMASSVLNGAQALLGGVSYTRLGSGWCDAGYYAGWDKNDATLENCMAKCNSEAKCHAFSLSVGRTCSRYDSRAGSCSHRPNGQNDHVSFLKEGGNSVQNTVQSLGEVITGGGGETTIGPIKIKWPSFGRRRAALEELEKKILAEEAEEE